MDALLSQFSSLVVRKLGFLKPQKTRQSLSFMEYKGRSSPSVRNSNYRKCIPHGLLWPCKVIIQLEMVGNCA